MNKRNLIAGKRGRRDEPGRGRVGEGRRERIGSKVLVLSIIVLGSILSSIYGSSNIELYQE